MWHKESNPKMKPFNLDEAKAGKPVMTAEGQPIRLICFDRNGTYPIIGLVVTEGGREFLTSFALDEVDTMLRMVAEVNEKTVYVNLYRKARGPVFTGQLTHDSREEAMRMPETPNTGDNLPIIFLGAFPITYTERL
jgi:hypothetical protein